MNPRPVVCLSVCHKDIEQTKLWLRWTGFLSRIRMVETPRMFVMLTQRAAPAVHDLMAAAHGIGFWIDWVICPDEMETGYPQSASHLFLRTLEHCERAVPGRSVLWVEADCAPLHHEWYRAIADEYEGCGHAFMGQRIQHPGRNTSHMTGIAVYPHDWRTRAPRILTAIAAPDHPMFAQGRGQPWDVWACAETTADLHETGLIQQIFNCPPFSPEKLNVLRPGAALFHRCKNGTLIVELARARYPEFLATLPAPTGTFQMIGHPSRLKTLGYPEMPWRAVHKPGGWLSTCTPTEPAHEAILRCLAGSKGVSLVDSGAPALRAV